jgi:hypothetical protein
MLQALRDVHWTFSEPCTAFHPRAYNLSKEADFEQFEVDFKWTAAAAVLRVVLRDNGFHPLRVPSREIADVALRVCQSRLEYVRCAALSGINASFRELQVHVAASAAPLSFGRVSSRSVCTISSPELGSFDPSMELESRTTRLENPPGKPLGREMYLHLEPNVVSKPKHLDCGLRMPSHLDCMP